MGRNIHSCFSSIIFRCHSLYERQRCTFLLGSYVFSSFIRRRQSFFFLLLPFFLFIWLPVRQYSSAHIYMNIAENVCRGIFCYSSEPLSRLQTKLNFQTDCISFCIWLWCVWASACYARSDRMSQSHKVQVIRLLYHVVTDAIAGAAITQLHRAL